MKGFNAAEISSFIKTTLARDYGRLLGSRFFQGAVQAVEQQAGSATFLVTLSRTGETATDGNLYLCSTPGYFPRTGDVVECVWLDSTVALVLWPVGGAQLGLLAPPAVVTANQTGITAEVNLAGLGVSAVIGSGRWVRVSWQLIAYSSVDGDLIAMQLKDTYNGVASVISQHWLPNKGASQLQTIHGEVTLAPSAGSHAYQLTLQRNTGTGSVSMIATPTAPATLTVEGIGG